MHRVEYSGAALVAALFFSASSNAQTAPLAPVEQTSLARDAFSTGTLDRAAGALGSNLWQGADAATLAMLMQRMPEHPETPAIAAAMRRLLLTPAPAPAGSPASLGGAKLIALVRAGFAEEARQVESLSVGANADPFSIEAMAAADLLSHDDNAACGRAQRVTEGLDASFWVRLRVFCYARANELDAAELALGVLRDSGGMTPTDDALLTPLSAGAAQKQPATPLDAVQYAAMRQMTTPFLVSGLGGSETGVAVAISKDAGVDWPVRVSAARAAVAAGGLTSADLVALYSGAPSGAAANFRDIAALSAPELLRDRAARIAAEISGSPDFSSFLLNALLYEDILRASEGVILDNASSISIALARIAVGDAIGAERWLSSAAPEIARGADDEVVMRYIEAASALAALDRTAAGRIASAANIQIASNEAAAAEDGQTIANLAPIVAAAIKSAAAGASGQLALSGLAASDAAAAGDVVADALLMSALKAAGLEDIVRRLEVERSLSTIFGASASKPDASITPVSSDEAGGLRAPRLKPKRSA